MDQETPGHMDDLRLYEHRDVTYSHCLVCKEDVIHEQLINHAISDRHWTLKERHGNQVIDHVKHIIGYPFYNWMVTKVLVPMELAKEEMLNPDKDTARKAVKRWAQSMATAYNMDVTDLIATTVPAEWRSQDNNSMDIDGKEAERLNTALLESAANGTVPFLNRMEGLILDTRQR